MRTLILVLAGLVAGCDGPSLASRHGKAKPHVGEVVTHPYQAAIWRDLDNLREHSRRVRSKAPNEKPPEELDRFKTGQTLAPGDLIEVLEVGDDYALIRGADKENSGIRGYVRSWWPK